jgi:hypothetical protein
MIPVRATILSAVFALPYTLIFVVFNALDLDFVLR